MASRGSDRGVNARRQTGLSSRVELERGNRELNQSDEQLKQRIEQPYSLHEIGKLVTASSGLDDVFTRIVEAAVSITKAQEGSLILLDELTNELYMRAQKGSGEEYARGCRMRVEDSIAEEVIETGEARRLTSRDRILKTASGSMVNSILYVPIVVRGRVIGVLSVANQTPDQPFSKDDENQLSVLADYAAVSTENVELLEELESKSQALKGLHKVNQSLLSIHDLQELLGTIAEEALEVLGANVVVLYEYLKERGDVRIPPIARGDIRAPDILRERGRIVPHKESVVFKMLQRDEPFYASNASEAWCKAGFFTWAWAESDDSFINREEIVSSAGIPLVDGEVVGVLFINYRVFHHFTPEHRERIESFANQAALAIRNARLFQEAQKGLDELTALYDTSREIAGRSLDIKSELQAILQRAVKLSNAQAGAVFLCDRAREEVKIVASHKFDELFGFAMKFGEGMAGRVAQSGQPMIQNEYNSWEGRHPIFEQEGYRELVRAVVQVPLKWGDEVIGVLAVSDASPDRIFTEDDILFLERLAYNAAIAVNDARTLSFLERLVKSSPDAIIAVDTAGTVTEFSAVSEQIMGYSRNEVVGGPVTDLYWGGLKEARRINHLLRESESGTVKHVETYVKSKEGKKIAILLSGALLYHEDGSRIGSVGILADLRIETMKGRTRRLLEAIEVIHRSAELQEVLDTIVLESAALLDADAACVLLAEDNFLKMKSYIGYPGEQVGELEIRLGQGVIGQAAQQKTAIAVPSCDATDRCYLLSDESRSGLAVAIVTESKVVGVLNVESKEVDHFTAEDELLHILIAQAAVAINRAQLLQETESAQRALIASANAVAASQIAVGVAHEIKNCLNNIALAVSNVGERIQKEPAIRAKKQFGDRIHAVETEVLRLSGLAQRLHRFSQRLEPEKAEVYLNQIVTNTLELLDSTFRERQMKYQVKKDPALDRPASGKGGHPVFVDERQIRQVIINLTLNAIDASSARGKLLFETKLHADTVEFGITDYGKGITQEEKRELFKPFFTTKPRGTGLGLYICKLIIEDNHGGWIDIQTKPGRGSTFSVFLPKQ